MLAWLACRLAPRLPDLLELPPSAPPDPLDSPGLLDRTRAAFDAARSSPFEPLGPHDPYSVLFGMGCRDLVAREADQNPDTAGRSPRFDALGPWAPVRIPVAAGPALTGHHSVGAPGAPVVIVVHGLFDSHTSAYVVDWAEALRRWGFHVFALDLRDHGQLLGGEHVATLGLREGRDLFEAARILGRAEGVSVGLLGLSYGAHCAVRAAHEATLAGAPEVLAGGVVSVCGPLDVREAIRALDDAGRLPRGPSFWNRRCLGFLVSMVQRQMRARMRQRGVRARRGEHFARFVREIVLPSFGDDEPGASAQAAPTDAQVDEFLGTARSAQPEVLGALRVPTLLVHSTDDPFVPVAHLHAALAAAGENPWVCGREIATGGHVGLAHVDPPGALALVGGFLARMRSG